MKLEAESSRFLKAAPNPEGEMALTWTSCVFLYPLAGSSHLGIFPAGGFQSPTC